MKLQQEVPTKLNRQVWIATKGVNKAKCQIFTLSLHPSPFALREAGKRLKASRSVIKHLKLVKRLKASRSVIKHLKLVSDFMGEGFAFRVFSPFACLRLSRAFAFRVKVRVGFSTSYQGVGRLLHKNDILGIDKI